MIVGGRPGSRGVVCSASYECRAYGVRSAMPISRALKLCPDAMCVPVPRYACSAKSRDIQQVLALHAPIVQVSSVDEWYLDLGGTEALYNHESLDITAHRIRNAVKDATGLNVSIGGGTSRLVAKMAVERAKPKPGTGANGVCCVAPGNEAAFLATLRLADLPMVGPRFAQQLEKLGLVTIAEAQEWSEADLVRRLGDRTGRWLHARVRGIDATAVKNRDHQKQVSREDTFARDLRDDASLEKELLRLAVRVSADIRRLGLRARTVTVKMRDADFRTRTARRTLSSPIETERAINRVAKGLFARLRRSRNVGVRLLGIALSHFDDEVSGVAEQLSMFTSPAVGISATELSATDSEPSADESERDRTLMKALDRIRDRFGKTAIVPARLLDKSTDPGPRVEE